jgi:hypothetical protein
MEDQAGRAVQELVELGDPALVERALEQRVLDHLELDLLLRHRLRSSESSRRSCAEIGEVQTADVADALPGVAEDFFFLRGRHRALLSSDLR